MSTEYKKGFGFQDLTMEQVAARYQKNTGKQLPQSVKVDPLESMQTGEMRAFISDEIGDESIGLGEVGLISMPIDRNPSLVTLRRAKDFDDLTKKISAIQETYGVLELEDAEGTVHVVPLQRLSKEVNALRKHAWELTPQQALQWERRRDQKVQEEQTEICLKDILMDLTEKVAINNLYIKGKLVAPYILYGTALRSRRIYMSDSGFSQ